MAEVPEPSAVAGAVLKSQVTRRWGRLVTLFINLILGVIAPTRPTGTATTRLVRATAGGIRMTLALLTTSLSPPVMASLEKDFGWTTLSSVGPGVLNSDGYDPADVGALVVEAELVDLEVLSRFPSLSLVGCVRGNPVNVDLEEATRRGVVVLGSPGRNAESVADLVLGLMLSVIRHIGHTHHLIVSRQLTEDRVEDRNRKDVVWRPSDPAGPVPYRIYKGPELATLTMGLLGSGPSGAW